MKLSPKKLTFVAKYGGEADRAKVSAHVDDLLDKAKADQGRLTLVSGDLALHKHIPLNDHHIHRIIDMEKMDGMNHPMQHLARWRPDELKDEHWDKIARTASDSDMGSIIPNMPVKHLPTYFNNEKRNPYLRKLAKDHYERKMLDDPDHLLKQLQS